MPKLAVLGQPVAHSRSPAMQTAALAELGLAPEWSYEAIEAAPEEFERLVRALPGRGFVGVNVTVPHKLAALALADTASDAAGEIGAANTLTFSEGAIGADNTDTVGLLEALPADPGGMRTLVLGAGGSARAAVWALTRAGAAVEIWNRTQARAEALAGDLGVAACPEDRPLVASDYDLIVNCTTVGLAAAGEPPAGVPDLKPLPVDADSFRRDQVVVDMVYGPYPTPLARVATETGAKLVDGLEILVHQGAASLRIWTGLEPPVETMRRAARE
jgi:shikimate dehydrogenase